MYNNNNIKKSFIYVSKDYKTNNYKYIDEINKVITILMIAEEVSQYI